MDKRIYDTSCDRYALSIQQQCNEIPETCQ